MNKDKNDKLKKKREEHLKEGKSFEGTLKLKVLLETVAGVDRTRLIKNLAIKNRYQANYKLTVGVDILTKDVEFRQGEFLTLSIWDIREQQRFEFIRSTFYKGAAGAILVFDLTREETYIQVRNWLTEIKQFAGENIPFILVGDNVHLFKLRDKPTIREEAREFANNEGGIYIETSPTSIDIIEGAIQKFVLNIIELRGNAPSFKPTKLPSDLELTQEESLRWTLKIKEDQLKTLEKLKEEVLRKLPSASIDKHTLKVIDNEILEHQKELEIFNNELTKDLKRLKLEYQNFLKNLRDGDYDFFPYPYIFKPPSPPGDAGAEAILRPEYIPPKKVSETTPYCKHCGADLSHGESICHACGKKTV